ncbi:MAG: hypothetical protein ABI823_07830 [Bryobacteraceae bacterium]
MNFLTEASWNGDHWFLAANGPGPRLAREAMFAALEHATPDAILSTGYCGALAASLSVADIFITNRVVAGDAGLEFEARMPEACAGRTDGTLLSVDRVAATAKEKSAMNHQGYAAVEMEAAGVAAFAQERALPFYCVRVVSDAAAESMPLDLNAYRDDDGRFRKQAIAAAALRRFSIAKDLIRLDRQCRAASEALGGFLANCRF